MGTMAGMGTWRRCIACTVKNKNVLQTSSDMHHMVKEISLSHSEQKPLIARGTFFPVLDDACPKKLQSEKLSK